MRQPVPFGKYVLLDRISIGGMAEVFRAKSFGVEGFAKIIAIKRILPTMENDEDFINMFVDEANIAGQLTHANIGQIHELGEAEGSHFIAMEYIQGRDLLQVQKRYRKAGKRIPVATACFILMKMCEGLNYAHRKRDMLGACLEIVHRDCSPQNVCISYEGEVKVIDFGIARAASRSSRTQAGVLKGKFAYMSPEQVRGLPLDRRSDIFSLGIVFFESLTGKRLFNAESDFSTLERVRNAEFDRGALKRAGVPVEVERIVLKALERSTEDRYQWCSEMRSDLHAYLQSIETVYTSRALGEQLRELFAKEFARDRELLQAYASINARGESLDDSADFGPGSSPGSSAPKSLPMVLVGPGSSPGSSAPRPTPELAVAEGSNPGSSAPKQEPPKPLALRTSADDASDFDDGATEVFGEDGLAGLLSSMGVSEVEEEPPLGDDSARLELREKKAAAPRGGLTSAPVLESPFTESGITAPRFSRSTGDKGVQPIGLSRLAASPNLPAPGKRAPAQGAKAPKGGSKELLIAFGVAALAVLMFITVKVFFLNGAAAAAETQATLVVMVGDNESAEVFVDAKPVGAIIEGETLTVDSLKPGSYELEVRRPGAVTCSDTIGITADKIKYYNCNFVLAKTASLLLEGLLLDDQVIIDGRVIGVLQLAEAFPILANKEHSVKISRSGKLLDDLVFTAKDGEERRHQVVDPEGVNEPDLEPQPEVTPPIDAGVAKRNKEPVVRVRVPNIDPKKRRGIVLKDDDTAKPRNDTVDDKQVAKRPPDGNGYFTAFTKPWARIYIDGKDTGKQTPVTPGGRIKLKPGVHKITFVAEGKKYNYSVTIEAGKTSKLAKILSP